MTSDFESEDREFESHQDLFNYFNYIDIAKSNLVKQTAWDLGIFKLNYCRTKLFFPKVSRNFFWLVLF